MRRAEGRLLIRLAVVILVMMAGWGTCAAQANKADDRETMQALLAEVRSLRQALQALQTMSLDSYRSQLLVDRIRVHREDVRRLSVSLSDTRDNLAKTQNTIPQFTERHKLLEARAQLEVDQSKRAELEFEARRLKEAVETYKSQVETLKEREQQMSSELNLGKSKLEELENRLELLERVIENDRHKLDSEKPAAPKSP
jgi:predicted  nucleic acid-binding Zn-ribbon protein